MNALREQARHEQLFFEGTAFMKAGDFARAEASFRAALALVSDFAEAHANLALALERRGAADEAELHYRRALELSADARTSMNFASLLLAHKRFDEAEAAYRQAVALEPQAPTHWSNLGVLYACLKREHDAERCYRVALSLDPSHRRAQFNLSYVLLRQGRYEEGWQRYEARDDYTAIAAYLRCPRWQGEALEGKSMLLTSEAGHGDMIMFARYVELLRTRGAAHITLSCHPALKTLFGTLAGVERVVALDEDLPQSGWDYWTPLASLPFHCQTRLESIPKRLPYLFAESSRVAAWRARLPRASFRVGLSWKGNPRFENDADRSLPNASALATLAGMRGVTLISLQKGAGEREALDLASGLKMIQVAPDITDFADTAAIIANLDLTISVDTAVAHLVGALGKPCWLLLNEYKTDWRWLTDRSDSLWYPGVMRLFRQQNPGDWSEPMRELREALEKVASVVAH